MTSPHYSTPDSPGARVALYHGDAIAVLRELPSASVHCAVTSPPYWGLRAYAGVEPVAWDGGAWIGCLGLEPSPDLFVAHLVDIFREVRRVLRDDGSCWVNLGDSFSGSGRGPTGKNGIGDQGKRQGFVDPGATNGGPWNLKAKDKCLIPHRFAIAMCDDGWYVRQDIVWAKGWSFCPDRAGGVMPESVTDRPTNAHEYVFMFTKSPRYFFDAEAVREASIHGGEVIALGEKSLSRGQADGAGVPRTGNACAESVVVTNGRNLRSVWALNSEPSSESHYAAFPSMIPRTCIGAGASKHGVCPKCGAPWERVSETTYDNPGNRTTNGPRNLGRTDETAAFDVRLEKRTKTCGWIPSCECVDAGDPVPATVLDPFVGTGTTGIVAIELGRSFVGIDASETYLRDIAVPRLKAARKGISVREQRAGQATLWDVAPR